MPCRFLSVMGLPSPIPTEGNIISESSQRRLKLAYQGRAVGGSHEGLKTHPRRTPIPTFSNWLSYPEKKVVPKGFCRTKVDSFQVLDAKLMLPQNYVEDHSPALVGDLR